MPLSQYGEQLTLNASIGLTSTWPSTLYLSLLTATKYTTGSPITVSQYSIYVPSGYDITSYSGTPPVNTGNNRIFIASTGGNTSGVEPVWSSVSTGGSVTDGTVTWTDVSSASYWLNALYLSEVTAGGYARATYANSSSNFASASGAAPAGVQNINTISWGPSTAGWGTVVAVGLHDASTSGNFLGWANLLTSQAVPTSTTLSIAGYALGLYLT